jgi:hypothetical protein
MENEIEKGKKLLCEEILAGIQSGSIKMRPRWYFILKTTLTMVGIVILIFLVVYLLSLIVFVERQSGAGFVSAFGPRGWARFLITLPWKLILFSLLFMGLLEILVRRYAFAYRRPLMYSAVCIIVLVVAGGLVVVSTRFHERFAGFAERQKLPLAPGFYKSYMMHNEADINPGLIEELRETGFVLTNRRGEILHVIMTPDTRMPMGNMFIKGDRVLVFGDRESTSSIRAFGVRKISD